VDTDESDGTYNSEDGDDNDDENSASDETSGDADDEMNLDDIGSELGEEEYL